MRVVCISDTHMQHPHITVPDGDTLIHTGDATWGGTVSEVAQFLRWFAALPHKHKVLIAGNHDWLFQKDPGLASMLLSNYHIHYLQDSAVEIEGLKVFGAPWQPEFRSWAFNLPRGRPLAEKWVVIPPDTDILVTHGPPHGILDGTMDGQQVGCEDLKKRLGAVHPKLHVFGHIHHAYGEKVEAGTHFVNASTCNEDYKPLNPPVVVEL